jgi:hypothetical protein
MRIHTHVHTHDLQYVYHVLVHARGIVLYTSSGSSNALQRRFAFFMIVKLLTQPVMSLFSNVTTIN